jgi:hypothetical protein
MRGCEESFGTLEAEVRGAFHALVSEALPAAARARGWPVASPAAFERLLLDHVLGAPGEAPGPSADAAAASVVDLMLAVETGARLLEGRLCVLELRRRSLARRRTRPSDAACASHTDPGRTGEQPPQAGRNGVSGRRVLR